MPQGHSDLLDAADYAAVQVAVVHVGQHTPVRDAPAQLVVQAAARRLLLREDGDVVRVADHCEHDAGAAHAVADAPEGQGFPGKAVDGSFPRPVPAHPGELADFQPTHHRHDQDVVLGFFEPVQPVLDREASRVGEQAVRVADEALRCREAAGLGVDLGVREAAEGPGRHGRRKGPQARHPGAHVGRDYGGSCVGSQRGGTQGHAPALESRASPC
mmetsp:Transcript_74777/g.241790  ORF Transcript_74777/g.241790 Transcript_74777/m.241790 type:complete len:215 (-) Transcript_74777:205-849(-)